MPKARSRSTESSKKGAAAGGVRARLRSHKPGAARPEENSPLKAELLDRARKLSPDGLEEDDVLDVTPQKTPKKNKPASPDASLRRTDPSGERGSPAKPNSKKSSAAKVPPNVEEDAEADLILAALEHKRRRKEKDEKKKARINPRRRLELGRDRADDDDEDEEREEEPSKPSGQSLETKKKKTYLYLFGEGYDEESTAYRIAASCLQRRPGLAGRPVEFTNEALMMGTIHGWILMMLKTRPSLYSLSRHQEFQTGAIQEMRLPSSTSRAIK
jgi:hypothetical protein